MSTKKRLLTIITLLLVITSSCLRDKPCVLEGTRWKLVGIVDSKTEELRELEPKNCLLCYTIRFARGNTFEAVSSTNTLTGPYELKGNGLAINWLTRSHNSEAGDGNLFNAPFVHFGFNALFLNGDELKMHFKIDDEVENIEIREGYLLFNRLNL